MSAAAFARAQQQSPLPPAHGGTVGGSSPWQYWPPEVIAAVTQCPLVNVTLNWPLIYRELELRGASSKANCAGAIGTTAIETASTFLPVREAFWLPEAWRAQNLRYYPYYGRGDIQLTWESNYAKASPVVGMDLVKDPDLALEPDTAAIIFAWYWTEERPTIPALADAHNWREVRRLVQGGSDGLDRLTRVAETLLAIE